MEDTTPVSHEDTSSQASNGENSTTTDAVTDPVSQPEGQGEQSDKRVQNAVAAVEKRNAEVKALLEVQADLVRDNPDYITKLAEKDPSLADRVVASVWGEDGIKSYSQLLKRVELERVKDSNPELYQTNLQLNEVQEKLKQREMKDRAVASQNFFTSKGIIPNEYDENYKKVVENLKHINPQTIEEDYEKALSMAYGLTFGGAEIRNSNAQPPSIPPAGAGVSSPMYPNSAPKYSETTQFLAQGLGVKL